MTNKEWLATLPAREFFDQLDMTIHKKAMWDINSRFFMIDWLDKEHTEKDEFKIKYFDDGYVTKNDYNP